MILSYCRACEYHETVQIDGKLQSRCQKESCLSIYTNCIAEEAVRKFISRNDQEHLYKSKSALEMCYRPV